MLLPLLTLGVLLATKPAPAEKVFTPCPRDTPEWTAARERLAALDARLGGLPDEGDADGAFAALQQTLASRCFEMSREEKADRPEKGVLASQLRTWWRDGGKAWVESYLDLGTPGARTVVLPPSVRPMLARETAPKDHRLASLLCPLSDLACAKGTEAWFARADAAFLPENLARSGISRDERRVDPFDTCEEAALKRPKRWRYTLWRRCLGDTLNSESALPLVRLRAPGDGWLVLRGRRGHYEFCDELRAYHLGTGAAWVSQSCSALVLREDPEHRGRVDGKKTDEGRQPRVKAGAVSPERLRELTWVLLLEDEPASRTLVSRHTVPEGFAVELRESPSENHGTVGGAVGGSVWGNTGQTRITWRWFPPGDAEPFHGEFTWPDSSDALENHADHLLEALEKDFVEGCPRKPAPLDVLDFTRATTVNRVDAPDGVAKPQDTLLEVLRAWKAPASCATPPP
ncbi:hypothetical protein LY474_09745 [Myxococcus stipitatus]|uniref:hypothetical protein n=1 Tax=Myxococcus stipitatus TaxID=83455 RepID=UPI001F38E744|nr:hypothetical protein [Myxococcus stipitatus]MCE9668095.1 hypothetical protein [Myxococcus stipitatus]